MVWCVYLCVKPASRYIIEYGGVGFYLCGCHSWWMLLIRQAQSGIIPHLASHSLPLLSIIFYSQIQDLTLFPPSFTLLALVDSGVTENFMLPHVVSFLSWLRRRLAVFNNKSHDRYKATGNGGAVEQMAFHFEPTHIYIYIYCNYTLLWLHSHWRSITDTIRFHGFSLDWCSFPPPKSPVMIVSCVLPQARWVVYVLKLAKESYCNFSTISTSPPKEWPQVR